MSRGPRSPQRARRASGSGFDRLKKRDGFGGVLFVGGAGFLIVRGDGHRGCGKGTRPLAPRLL